MRPSAGVPTPPGYGSCRALLDYEGPARDLIARIKYRNERGALPWLAARMADLVAGTDVDVVTWAPTTQRRRRSRGFDQAELLARRIARQLRTPCRSLLLHLPGDPQTGLDAEDRAAGPTFRGTRSLGGEVVLVVDDVVTTGSTLTAAGQALFAAGAGALHAVVAAHPR